MKYFIYKHRFYIQTHIYLQEGVVVVTQELRLGVLKDVEPEVEAGVQGEPGLVLLVRAPHPVVAHEVHRFPLLSGLVPEQKVLFSKKLLKHCVEGDYM